jgi:hypothetical protein
LDGPPCADRLGAVPETCVTAGGAGRAVAGAAAWRAGARARQRRRAREAAPCRRAPGADLSPPIHR